MLNVADEIPYPTISLSGYWYRLIPSRFPTVDLYRRVSQREQWPLATTIETMTNPRIRLKEKITKGLSGNAELSPKLQNWNHAPYSYRNPEGSRFLSDQHGVLELADTIQTALAVSIRKREAFLAATKMPPLDLEMRVLRHEVKGLFRDIRSLPLDIPQGERWKLGERLLEAGAAGVRFQCPQRPNGICIAVFNGEVLCPSIQTQHYKFRWDGSQIAELYDFRDDNDGRATLPGQIFA